jgi:hypothetical protein
LSRILFFALLFSFSVFATQHTISRALVDSSGYAVSIYVAGMDSGGSYRCGVRRNSVVRDSARVRLTSYRPAFKRTDRRQPIIEARAVERSAIEAARAERLERARTVGGLRPDSRRD